MDGTITTPAARRGPLPADAALPKPPSVLRRVASHPGLVAWLALLGLCGAMALLAPLISPHDPYVQDLNARLIPPVWYEKG